MSEIYRRYNPNQQQSPRQRQEHSQNFVNSGEHTSSVHKGIPQVNNTPVQKPCPPVHENKPAVHTVQNKPTVTSGSDNVHPVKVQKPSKKEPTHKNSPPRQNFLFDFIPKNIYNPETRKILGLLSAEDLLLVALIFLFLEEKDEDNPLMVLALAYVLLSDYIDLGDFIL